VAVNRERVRYYRVNTVAQFWIESVGNEAGACFVSRFFAVSTGRVHCLRCNVPPEEFQLLGADLGSVGDLCRATLQGDGETEPKQIGEGIQDST
jgi:hypothetical protein